MKDINRTIAALVASVLTTAVGLTGCGDDSDAGAMPGATEASQGTKTSIYSTGEHNDADVTFAGNMILHHQLALQMASTAGYQATSPAVKKLATAVKAAHDREIRQMSTWLISWDKPIPSPSHDHGPADEIPGMMSEDEWSELGRAEGAVFDRMWIQLMIKHHKGAIAMAKTEQSNGKNAGAIAFATKVQASQSAEITAMQKLLSRLPAA